MPTVDTPPARTEDDFVLKSQIKRPDSAKKKAERRLHLRAFDYWHELHSGKPLPLFSDLTAEGLLPFKRNCLLLEFSQSGTIVRFCGSELAPLLGGTLVTGSLLSTAKITTFADALEARFSTSDGRQEAAEFEFVDEPVECRGILLPFSAYGKSAEFLMVVVNHRQRTIGVDERQKISLEDEKVEEAKTGSSALEKLAEGCSKAGRLVVHPGVNTREGLYGALAEAYRFHIEAARDQTAYRLFLRSRGMYQQRRAPFTPALKLTFGINYEKTRLTEYATALSYAARHEVSPDQLPDFLKHEPGGIKGCVGRERAFRRGEMEPGLPEKSTDALRAAARSLKGKALADLSLQDEFSLVLVRRQADGSAALLSTVRTSNHMVDRAISHALSAEE